MESYKNIIREAIIFFLERNIILKGILKGLLLLVLFTIIFLK